MNAASWCWCLPAVVRRCFLPAAIALTVLCEPRSLHASASALADLQLQSFSLTPQSGQVSLIGLWQVSSFAEATNSNGGFSQDFHSASSSASAFATVPGAAALTSGSVPPVAGLPNRATSILGLPGGVDLRGTATARTTLTVQFMIVGGTGPVGVTFAAMLSAALQAVTDAGGTDASAELVFAAELNGSPLLSYFDSLAVGPSGFQARSATPSLMTTQTLNFGQTYTLVLDVDAEVAGGTVPEAGPSFILLLLGIAALFLGKGWRLRVIVCSSLLAGGFSASAKYIGCDPPQICRECGQPR